MIGLVQTHSSASLYAFCKHSLMPYCVQVLFLMSEERLIFRTPFNQSAVQNVH